MSVESSPGSVAAKCDLGVVWSLPDGFITVFSRFPFVCISTKIKANKGLGPLERRSYSNALEHQTVIGSLGPNHDLTESLPVASRGASQTHEQLKIGWVGSAGLSIIGILSSST